MFSTSSKKQNLLVDLIVMGYGSDTFSDAAGAVAKVKEWGGDQALETRNAAWDRLKEYYTSL